MGGVGWEAPATAQSCTARQALSGGLSCASQSPCLDTCREEQRALDAMVKDLLGLLQCASVP